MKQELAKTEDLCKECFNETSLRLKKTRSHFR